MLEKGKRNKSSYLANILLSNLTIHIILIITYLSAALTENIQFFLSLIFIISLVPYNNLVRLVVLFPPFFAGDEFEI